MPDMPLATPRIAADPELSARWQALLTAEPRLRIRDAAARLGVSERDLLGIAPATALTRIGDDWAAMIAEIASLGEVMALTRNDHCVHEKTGIYGNASAANGVGLVLMSEIDLRLFYHQWATGFAVTETGGESVKRSLQFFDKHGVAVHKIYAKPATDLAAWDAFVARWTLDEPVPVVEPYLFTPDAQQPDDAIDIALFRDAWDRLTDTHDFFPMLRRFKLGRVQALRLAGAERARPVAVGAVRHMLLRARDTALPIMCFVGSKGVIQIHTGPVHHIVDHGKWLNVMDPRFNLHLDESAIAGAWVVYKPTSDGTVTSLEIFDSLDQTIALFFGKRKPGEAEDGNWRAVLADLPDLR